MSRNAKVIVAMSGGVDSSVAACLLKEQGYDCVGVFMRVGNADEGTEGPRDSGIEGVRGSEIGCDGCDTTIHTSKRSHVPASKQGCCSAEDALDARNIAGKLGIPFYALNFENDFAEIIDYFVDEYAGARTPNPCIMCNIHLKFGKLVQYADAMDAEFVATGHYARVTERDGTPHLMRSKNADKDQSYVLFGIERHNLARCLFPLGEVTDKEDVRKIAARLGLDVYDKPESQEICFVPDNDYRRLVRERRPETQRPGDIIDSAGNVIGRHTGIVNYTIGQRRGLGIPAGKPIYVTRLNVLDNTVTVGPKEDVLSSGLVAGRVNWLTDPPPIGQKRPVQIRIRHQHRAADGHVERMPDERIAVEFAERQNAVTPGQAAVVYDGDVVLGGGWIEERL